MSTKMVLSVIGATGRSGLALVEEALEQGHQVKAIVRTPSKITTTHENLQVIEADLTDATKLTEHFRGSNAVLSAIGGKGGYSNPCDVYTTTGKAAIKAMRENGIKRFVCITAWGTKDDPNLPFVWRWIFKPTFVPNVVKNMDEFEEYLAAECDDIDYTVVRPPRLTNAPSEGKQVNANEGQTVTGYKSSAISRHDVAKFMLSCLSTDTYNKKMVAVNTE